MYCHFALAQADLERKVPLSGSQIDKSCPQPYDLGYGKGEHGVLTQCNLSIPNDQ